MNALKNSTDMNAATTARNSNEVKYSCRPNGHVWQVGVWVPCEKNPAAEHFVVTAHCIDKAEAFQKMYMLNGWGLAKWTVADDENGLVRDALRVLDRHVFNGSYISKVNADVFKAILARISGPARRSALISLWKATYEHEAGKMADAEYKAIKSKNLMIATAR